MKLSRFFKGGSVDELELDDGGRPILEPIVYEPVPGGWRVPDHERKRWEDNRWMSNVQTPVLIPPPPAPKPLAEIITDLEPYMYLSTNNRALLHDAYDVSPYQTWQLAEDVRKRRDRLDNPAGVLVSRLRQILSQP